MTALPFNTMFPASSSCLKLECPIPAEVKDRKDTALEMLRWAHWPSLRTDS